MDGLLDLNYLAHLIIVSLMALPIGCKREMSKRNFGLHTFPLVAVVTCGCRLAVMSVG